MCNLTEAQKLRVFAMYLGCPCEHEKDGDTKQCPMYWQLLNGNPTYQNMRLLLRPLSAISDEDAIEVAEIISFARVQRWYVRRDGDVVAIDGTDKNEDMYGGTITIFGGHIAWSWYNRDKQDGYELNTHHAYEYLIQQGYSVPLFIAPGHPDNSKTAIDLGLAIDSTLNPVSNV